MGYGQRREGGVAAGGGVVHRHSIKVCLFPGPPAALALGLFGLLPGEVFLPLVFVIRIDSHHNSKYEKASFRIINTVRPNHENKHGMDKNPINILLLQMAKIYYSLIE